MTVLYGKLEMRSACLRISELAVIAYIRLSSTRLILLALRHLNSKTDRSEATYSSARTVRHCDMKNLTFPRSGWNMGAKKETAR